MTIVIYTIVTVELDKHVTILLKLTNFKHVIFLGVAKKDFIWLF